jgi:KDO2-lipid IV(A) lauroyltransferase
MNAFPEKSLKEIISIEKKFYSHLADLFVETMKLTHMSERELRQRFVIKNLELLDRLYENKKDIIAIMAHYNNWEWLTILSPQTRYKTISIYKPLHNKWFNNLVNSFRTKYGMVLTPMQAIVRELVKDRAQGINTLSAFINDQTPPVHELKYWTRFLNQDTPMFMGADKIASRYDMSIVYFHVEKIKRGYYQLNIELLFENTAGLPENIITETHVKHLEKIIRAQPQYWIWSHRRWKHKKPVANA